MIKKQYRLKEKEVKKVLQKAKPFFSYGVVLNKSYTKLEHNRFAIVIGAKSTRTNVERNFFRRRFYDIIYDKIIKFGNMSCKDKSYNDYVFVVKKITKLDKKNKESVRSFERDINFLINKT